MDQVQLHQKIDELNDTEAERCLQVLIKGFAVRHDYEALFDSEKALQDVIRQYDDLIMEHKQKEVPKEPQSPTTEPVQIASSKLEDPQKRVEGVRAILHAIADDDQLRPTLDSWVESGRPTLLDPITAALVLAGIVFVLSVDIDIKVKRDKDGKVEWEAGLKKEPTKESILGKFFSLFQ